MTDLAVEPQPETGTRIVLSPTVSKFVLSRADAVLLYGPRREGKTTGAVAAILHHAERYPDAQPIKWAAVRDTWTNLNRTVMETLREGAARGWWDVEFTQQGTEAILNGGVARLYLLGMDRPADANRFQGLELGGVWIDEAAPAADLTSGVPVDVFAMAISCTSQARCQPRVQITTNPPDEDSWVIQLPQELARVGKVGMSVEIFSIPPGENKHLPLDYRERMRAGFEAAGRPDLVARLVEGQIGGLQMGAALVPPFSRLLHVAKRPLEVYRNLDMIRLWDSGAGDLHPSCVFIQAAPKLGVNVLASCVAENVGVTELIEEQVKPMQVRYGWSKPVVGTVFGRGAHGGFTFRDIGDPACLVPSGVSSQLTVAKTIASMLGGSFEPGPQDWTSRREALLAGFAWAGKGDRPRFIQIDPDENDVLIKALAGRAHFPKDQATGRIVGTLEAAKRASGIYMHPVMALAYGLAVMFPAEEFARTVGPPAPRTRATEPPKSWLGA